MSEKNPAPIVSTADGPTQPPTVTSTTGLRLMAPGSTDPTVTRGKCLAMDIVATTTEYLDHSDWRVNTDANQGYSPDRMMLSTSGKVATNYWLSQVCPATAGQIHRDVNPHIHNLDMFAGYYTGWSFKDPLQRGSNGVPDAIAAGPVKHFSSAVGQIVNFLSTLQNG